jgi:hypothetical protein
LWHIWATAKARKTEIRIDFEPESRVFHWKCSKCPKELKVSSSDLRSGHSHKAWEARGLCPCGGKMQRRVNDDCSHCKGQRLGLVSS